MSIITPIEITTVIFNVGYKLATGDLIELELDEDRSIRFKILDKDINKFDSTVTVVFDNFSEIQSIIKDFKKRCNKLELSNE